MTPAHDHTTAGAVQPADSLPAATEATAATEAPPQARLNSGRIRFILIGAVIGIAWAASLRGFMQQLAGPASTFSFSGTFGIIIPAGTATGALLGWAEYQRRLGRQYPLLIAAPLLIVIFPTLGTGQLDGGPIGLALGAMAGGYSVSGRGPLWARIVAAVAGFAGVPVTFFAPKPYPDLSFTTPHGAWFCTLASALFVTLALACSIPMLRPGVTRQQ
jgi:hypothetical protein